jgi:Tfp pilus assembly protein PilF
MSTAESEQIVSKAHEAMAARNWHQASVLLTRALTLDPENPALLCMRAEAFTKLCFFESALLDTTNALKLQPDNVDALLCKADAYASINEVDVALRLYLHAFEEQADQRNPEPGNGNLQQQLHKVLLYAAAPPLHLLLTPVVCSSMIRSEHATAREDSAGCKGCNSMGAHTRIPACWP